ncbi:uncharacterized protein LOC117172934 isoform X2 [Belonocnema kinseyi]|uniref:uncharacterized protein LOC117172934 isoform X2 n=1 Tax=Belonocnema kinseyi TaxID=2817044 RepID=UPI00143D06EE|nr:uncharacterized protein LOC117172934 isoform X2 [Belonocnema kinseyi]
MKILIFALFLIFTVFLQDVESTLGEIINRDGSIFTHHGKLARMNPDGSIHVFSRAELQRMDKMPLSRYFAQRGITVFGESSGQRPLSPVKFQNDDVLHQGSEAPAVYRGQEFYKSGPLQSEFVLPRDGAVVTRNEKNYAVHENGAFRRWTPEDDVLSRRTQ